MTKRKTPEEKATRKPRKRVAFKASTNAATRAIIAKNASNSPLLRLPLEVRNKIWREVLGDRLIHLAYLYDREKTFDENDLYYSTLHWSSTLEKEYGSAWMHLVCEEDGPENREHKKIEIPSFDADGTSVHYIRPHFDCEPDYPSPSPSRPINFYGCHETMHLTILRSCRQTYVEANQILWTTNTFSFSEGFTFKRFMMTRNIHQKRMIRNLRMELEFSRNQSCEDWNGAMNMAVVRSLSGLRQLRLQIEYGLETRLYNMLKDLEARYLTIYCQGLHKLSILPLTNVEICVRNPEYVPQDLLWSKTDRDEYADGLRALLLDSEGDKIYAADQLAAKEENRQWREEEAHRKSFSYRSRLSLLSVE